MSSEHWAELVVAADSLDDAWLEDILRKLDDLECGVRSVWAWLDDDCVASEKRRSNLAERENNWEIPWADSTFAMLVSFAS